MSESIFLSEGDLVRPTEHARGPWDPNALHGGAPAALITAAFERVEPGAELPFARLSFEFLRPVPMAPLQLTIDVSRPGRRVQALEAQLSAGDTVVCRASALRLLATPDQLPEQTHVQVEATRPLSMPPPEEGHSIRFALDDQEASFAASAMEMRFLSGQPLGGELPKSNLSAAHQPSGEAAVWMRLRHPLLPEQPLTPLARLAATSDFGNGVAAVLRFDRYLFINADLAISLDRRPAGEWIGMQSRTVLHPGGIGWSESALHDERGPCGRATQALVVQPR